jgi:hypothetical protein
VIRAGPASDPAILAQGTLASCTTPASEELSTDTLGLGSPEKQVPGVAGTLDPVHRAALMRRLGRRRIPACAGISGTAETSLLPRHRQCPQARRCPVPPGGIPSIEPPWLRFTALGEVPRLTSLTSTA